MESLRSLFPSFASVNPISVFGLIASARQLVLIDPAARRRSLGVTMHGFVHSVSIFSR